MHACIHSSLSRLFIFPTTNSICVCVGDAWQVRRPDTNFYEPTYEPPPHRNQKRTAPSMNSPPTAAILVSSPAQLWRVFLAAQVGVSAHAVVLASTRCCVSLAHAEWGCLTSSCVESGGSGEKPERTETKKLEQIARRTICKNRYMCGVMNMVRLSCMKDTSPWCNYLVSPQTTRLETISRRREECPYQNPSPKERTCEAACCYRDMLLRRSKLRILTP
jgi:hypothetical protein